VAGRLRPGRKRDPSVSLPSVQRTHVSRWRFPDPVRGYLLGRVLAYILAAGGLLAVVVGVLATLGLVFARGALLNGVGLPSLPSNPLTGPIVIAGGLAAVLAAQLALALFNCANAARELVALERAKVEQAHRNYR
jgi:hypothetical protein